MAGEASTRPEQNVDGEILALFPRPICLKPFRIPLKNSLALFGISILEKPVICGFNDTDSGCFEYAAKERHWIPQPFSVNEERTHSSGTWIGDDSWIIIGGQKYLQGSPVILNTSGTVLLLTTNKGY